MSRAQFMEQFASDETVRYGIGEYVSGQAHTNGIASFWLMLKRGYVGIYHMFSLQHLDRYVKEYAERHNLCELDTIAQMALLVPRFSNV